MSSTQQSPAPQDPTLTFYTGLEERPPPEWEERYVDVWLLLEITEEDEGGEPVRAKLIATTTDPMREAFQHLWRSYAARNTLTLFTHSKYSEPHPHVVAHAA